MTTNGQKRQRRIPQELIEQVREAACAAAGRDDDELAFYTAARDLGLSSRDAASVERILTLRIMRSRGVI